MCYCKITYRSPVLMRCFKEGHMHCFRFEGNELVDQDNSKNTYSIVAVKPIPEPCTTEEIIVYKFCTPDGIMGHSVLSFYHNQEQF